MAPNFIGPYWVNINYHGAIAPHSMSIPTKNWNPGVGSGTFDIWSGGVIAASAMIIDMVDMLKTQFSSDTGFDNYVIYKQLTDTDVPQPVYSGAFVAKVGTNASGSWGGAVEKLMLARSLTFGLAKLTLLDAASDNDFNPRYTMSVTEDALYTEWASDAKGWCARDNGQINTFLKITLNLNQKLRREYRLT